jgi:putative nucleotidyltransferase with HDIG domain
MIKRIPLQDLRPGMHIHDLNCSWVVHPLFLTRFKVKSEEEIEKIVEMGVREVYIDSELGDDWLDGLSLDDVRTDIESEMLRLAEFVDGRTESTLPFDEEIEVAAGLQGRATDVVRKLMSDARMGRQFGVEGVADTVESIAQSVLRNPSALIRLSQIRARDDYTFLHSVGVCTLMTSFCNTLHLNRDISRQISIGAILHDIGKMKVSEAILNKPGRLTDMEFDEMKNHVKYGSELVASLTDLSSISLDVLEQHHERYDGSGYPSGLKADNISPFGQMAAIVDVYDAITSARVYHQPMEAVEALRKIQEWSKYHFNEELAGHFIRSIGIYPVGTLVRLESDRLAVVKEQASGDLLRPVVRIIYDIRKGWDIMPYDLDLAEGAGRADRILNYELPEHWGIDVGRYLTPNLS